MEEEPPKKKKKWDRRSFTPEFKAEAVRLCTTGTRSVRQVARDLDLTETALRNWVKQAGKPAAKPVLDGGLTASEREELVRLRRENKRLLIEREILKKATAFFAKENG
jgi:transposase